MCAISLITNIYRCKTHYWYKIDHVHLLVHTTCYIHHYLHEGLEVVVSIHLLHIVSQHFITEDVVILVREERCYMDDVCHTRRIAT